MAKILLIDDDALVRNALKGFLEIGGYDVVPVAHGRKALDAIARDDFQLVLTDILMPEMEGLETIRRLRSMYPTMAIVAMSSGPAMYAQNAGADYLQMALEFGATEILRKPFSARQLLDVVDACL
jgi:CheY-like chemotaxis protein